VAIQIPTDILEVQRASLAEAAAWRRSTRSAFLRLREMGYQVVGFQRDPGPCRYLLAPAPAPGPEGGSPEEGPGGDSPEEASS
jgi:predicted GNAT superfamily acetyltransferase